MTLFLHQFSIYSLRIFWVRNLEVVTNTVPKQMLVFSTVDTIWQYVVIGDVTVVVTAHTTDFPSCIWWRQHSDQPVEVKLYHQVIFCLETGSPAVEGDGEPSSRIVIRQTDLCPIKL